ncbi:acetolactate synthase large subunit [Bradyrhizobium sp. 41S5]|uniref:acetolactate synthase large subunit n=1 Tax=Bradyrhizobium sp. 41S5 TaxID=1404443 RepID=UPI00156B90C2|nr:acetolactate synthase large subunit [Bradyrhizobium sp. 41S5]UFX44463.1 acetolactate synthase large subunit [Bradyrhizobium sp. 41S5]
MAMNGAQALFKALTDAGLNTCFANPGTSEMQLVYEMGRTGYVRPVLCLQENTVTGAADGYARMAGKPAFTLLHVGSGFANGLANLHNAGRANTTMVNIVGANATYHQPNFAEHEFINGNIVDLARVVSHWAHQAKNASDLAVLGAEAARYSRLGAGKICTVVAPTNCSWDPAVAPPMPCAPIETPKVSPQCIQDVVALLTNGKKTGILLGSHTLYGEGLELAGRIAAATGATLFAETFAPRFARGEGRVAVDLLGYLPEQSVPQLQSYAQLILVGALFPVTTFAYKGKSVFKVPESCAVTTLATVDHDLLAALGELAKAVGTPSRPVARRVRSEAAPPTGVLSAKTIAQTLTALMPKDAILVDEGATNGGPICDQTEGARAHDLLIATNGGAIGNGLPLALGASVACPDRKTVVMQGDGCGMYTEQALWSMAREKADVTVVMLKNDDYAILEIELARVREGDANAKMEALMHLDDPTLNWVKIAEGHGVTATQATTAEEFHRQFEVAMQTKGPHLIEAQIVENLKPMIDAVHKARVP